MPYHARIAIALLSFALAGCYEGSLVEGFTCANPDRARIGVDGLPDPCGRHAPQDDCRGDCVLLGGADFRREAVLLWMGPPAEEPDCPERANGLYYEGYSGLIAPPDCPTCSCVAPSCVLPGGVIASEGNLCAGPGFVDVSTGEGWDGQCVSPGVIPPGSFLSMELLTPTVSACQPVIIADPPALGGPISWQTAAKACQGVGVGTCADTNEICLPTAEPPPPGFRQCVQYMLPVDEAKLPECGANFPERFVFYSGAEDERQCSPCTCGDPIGSQCDAAVSAFQEPMCGNAPPALFKDALVGLGASGICHGVMPTSTLAALSATWKVNKPGSCEPGGGEPSGEARPIEPRVFCCQPPPGETQ